MAESHPVSSLDLEAIRDERLAALLDEAREFLNGSGPSPEGVHFGGFHPEHRGQYWWRSYWIGPLLLEVAAALRSRPPEGLGDVGDALDYLEQSAEDSAPTAIDKGHVREAARVVRTHLRAPVPEDSTTPASGEPEPYAWGVELPGGGHDVVFNEEGARHIATRKLGTAFPLYRTPSAATAPSRAPEDSTAAGVEGGRSPEGQALLDRAQEVRAIKRPQDPVWPILTFVEAMNDAASMLDSENSTTAERLRRGVNYLLNAAARLEAVNLEETKRQMVLHFREAMDARGRGRSAGRLRGEFQIANRVGTPSRGPYLTVGDYETVDAALSLLEHLDQDARPLPNEAVEQEIHGLCPGHPIAKDRAATCAVCNMSRVTLDRLAFLDITGMVEWAEACGYSPSIRRSAPQQSAVAEEAAPPVEPVAWMVEVHTGLDGESLGWHPQALYHLDQRYLAEGHCFGGSARVVPLYSAPPSTAAVEPVADGTAQTGLVPRDPRTGDYALGASGVEP